MKDSEAGVGSRRYLKSREKPWAQKLARWVGDKGVSPNAISVLSIAFSILAAWCFVAVGTAGSKGEATLLWLGAAVGIQMRLLCNLLDGMVAIEGGKKSVVGGLYNEVPDRIADPLILAAAGYTTGSMLVLWGVPLGWLAAAFSIFTAYIRVLGGTLGVAQSFIGPMAKQHRMFVLTLACFVNMIEIWLAPLGSLPLHSMRTFLILIIIGCVITSWRRLSLISRELYKQA